MQSLLRFARSLRGRAEWHSSRSRGFRATMTYIARSLLHWRQHAAWLTFLDAPAMAGLAAVDRTLTERYQHRYMNRHWSMMQRLAATRGHYAFAVDRFPAALFDQLYRQREVHVGRLVLRNGSGVSLLLKAPSLRGREGELSISLTDDWGLQISYATLSFVDGGRRVIIGCLQGAANNAGRDAIRELTRQSHGLRPKNLLLSMIRSLAEAMGAEHVLGIGNEAHPFATRKKIKADYDTFWQENGGVADAQGFFAMPVHEPVRCASSVESKRRSEFRRREALRREACDLLVAAFVVPQAVLAEAA
ncbi:hypothetical protein C8J98_11329 [Luteibacter sp. OK325]|uniref:VirK/YbjX family protein n=1 Tax=Luteibacter sp. OK325 TaxID=2135670 RepID=UPI000D3F288E|nr:DUF535 family protein [Luteibacter sp. OK325]PTR23941.1 hypothetical protein C8J98_11329 [Luteibacter sp. OK325]